MISSFSGTHKLPGATFILTLFFRFLYDIFAKAYQAVYTVRHGIDLNG